MIFSLRPAMSATWSSFGGFPEVSSSVKNWRSSAALYEWRRALDFARLANLPALGIGEHVPLANLLLIREGLERDFDVTDFIIARTEVPVLYGEAQCRGVLCPQRHLKPFVPDRSGRLFLDGGFQFAVPDVDLHERVRAPAFGEHVGVHDLQPARRNNGNLQVVGRLVREVGQFPNRTADLWVVQPLDCDLDLA